MEDSTTIVEHKSLEEILKIYPGVLDQLKESNVINYNKITEQDLIDFINNEDMHTIGGKLMMENYGHSFKNGIINE